MTEDTSPAGPVNNDSDAPTESPDLIAEANVPELNETEVDEAVMAEDADNPALDEGRVITPVDEEDDDDDPRQG